MELVYLQQKSIIMKKNEKDDFEVVKAQEQFSDSSLSDVSDSDEEKFDDSNDTLHSKAERVALGSLMLRKKSKQDLIDSGYNRYAFNDTDEVPRWFKEEEQRHNKAQLPITKEMIQEIKNKYAEINAKDIKKVAEAKARKKKKSLAKMEKAKSKATKIADSSELTNKQKSKQIEQLYKKSSKTVKPSKVYVVSRSFKNGKNNAAGAAKKGGGKSKVVDKRLKKDTRGLKRAEAKKGKAKKR